MDRRRFLGGAMVFGACVAAVPASAFRFEEPSAENLDLYQSLAACHGKTYHDRLIAEIDAVLRGESVAEDDRERLLAQVSCPICGCRMASTVPDDPAGRF